MPFESAANSVAVRRGVALACAMTALAVAPLRGDVVERVMAQVNSQIVTLSEFQARQAAAVQQNRIPDEQIEPFLRENNARLLEEAMEELLLVDRGIALGFKLRPESLDQIIEDIKKEQNITSEEQFQTQLKQEGLTLEALRRNIERSIVVRQVRSREVEPKAQVVEADVRAEYERRKKDDFTKKASVHLFEIVAPDEAAATAALARVRAGEDFEAVAREVSTAASRPSGGDLGRVEPDDLSDALRTAIASLAPGQTSGPIRIDTSYRLLKVRERLSDEVTPFDQVKEKLFEEMARAKFEKAYTAYIADLKRNAVWRTLVREAPTRLASQKRAMAAPAAVSGDDEISTSGAAAPERVVVPSAQPTPTVRPRH